MRVGLRFFSQVYELMQRKSSMLVGLSATATSGAVSSTIADPTMFSLMSRAGGRLSMMGSGGAYLSP